MQKPQQNSHFNFFTVPKSPLEQIAEGIPNFISTPWLEEHAKKKVKEIINDTSIPEEERKARVEAINFFIIQKETEGWEEQKKEEVMAQFRDFLLGKSIWNNDLTLVPWGKKKLVGDDIDVYLENMIDAKLAFDKEVHMSVNIGQIPRSLRQAWVYFCFKLKNNKKGVPSDMYLKLWETYYPTLSPEQQVSLNREIYQPDPIDPTKHLHPRVTQDPGEPEYRLMGVREGTYSGITINTAATGFTGGSGASGTSSGSGGGDDGDDTPPPGGLPFVPPSDPAPTDNTDLPTHDDDDDDDHRDDDMADVEYEEATFAVEDKLQDATAQMDGLAENLEMNPENSEALRQQDAQLRQNIDGRLHNLGESDAPREKEFQDVSNLVNFYNEAVNKANRRAQKKRGQVNDKSKKSGTMNQVEESLFSVKKRSRLVRALRNDLRRAAQKHRVDGEVPSTPKPKSRKVDTKRKPEGQGRKDTKWRRLTTEKDMEMEEDDGIKIYEDYEETAKIIDMEVDTLGREEGEDLKQKTKDLEDVINSQTGATGLSFENSVNFDEDVRSHTEQLKEKAAHVKASLEGLRAKVRQREEEVLKLTQDAEKNANEMPAEVERIIVQDVDTAFKEINEMRREGEEMEKLLVDIENFVRNNELMMESMERAAAQASANIQKAKTTVEKTKDTPETTEKLQKAIDKTEDLIETLKNVGPGAVGSTKGLRKKTNEIYKETRDPKTKKAASLLNKTARSISKFVDEVPIGRQAEQTKPKRKIIKRKQTGSVATALDEFVARWQPPPKDPEFGVKGKIDTVDSPFQSKPKGKKKTEAQMAEKMLVKLTAKQDARGGLTAQQELGKLLSQLPEPPVSEAEFQFARARVDDDYETRRKESENRIKEAALKRAEPFIKEMTEIFPRWKELKAKKIPRVLSKGRYGEEVSPPQNTRTPEEEAEFRALDQRRMALNDAIDAAGGGTLVAFEEMASLRIRTRKEKTGKRKSRDPRNKKD